MLKGNWNSISKQLQAKIKELESIKGYYLDWFLLTKEQYDAIPENMLIRKLNISIIDVYNHDNFNNFSILENSEFGRKMKMMTLIAIGLLIVVILVIIWWFLIIHFHSEPAK